MAQATAPTARLRPFGACAWLDDDAESATAFTRRDLDCLDELLDQRRSDFMQES